MKLISIIAGVLLGVTGAQAATDAAAPDPIEIRHLADGQAPQKASLDELAWLVGSWKGEGLGGEAYEVISVPADGQMMGMFRSHKADGSLRFYEFYVFAETDNGLMLRIKHFTRDFVGWETKDKFVEFPLVAIEEEAVYFDGLTFALDGPDQLRSGVTVEGQGNFFFRYDRQ